MISDPRYKARRSAEKVDDDDIIVFSDEEEANPNPKYPKTKII